MGNWQSGLQFDSNGNLMVALGAGGGAGAGLPNTITAIGDSIMARMGLLFPDLQAQYGIGPISSANVTDFYYGKYGVHHIGSSFLARACMRTNCAFMPYEFIYAMSSTTSTQILNYVVPLVLANPYPVKPGYCLVISGTNDPVNSIPAATTLANNQSICQQLIGAGIKPILGSLLPINAQAAPAYQINIGQQRLAQKLGIPYVDFWSPLANASGQWANAAWNSAGDGVHPAPRGADIMGFQLSQVLNTLAPPNARANFWASGSWVSTDPLFQTLTGTINVAASYPTAFGAPTVTTKVNSSAGTEPGTGLTMYQGPTTASDTPNFLGNSWTLTGDGTHTNVNNLSLPFNVSPGDVLLMRARIKAICATSDASAFNAQMYLQDTTNSYGLMGFDTGSALGGASVGNETGYIAGDYLQLYTVRNTVTNPLTLYAAVLANSAGGAPTTNDSFTLANFGVYNLTKGGLVV